MRGAEKRIINKTKIKEIAMLRRGLKRNEVQQKDNFNYNNQ
jgi:hypothetical protein